MKSRMKNARERSILCWNYWEPAGPWDYKSDGRPSIGWGCIQRRILRIDVEAIVSAREHGLVFEQEDMGRLIATNGISCGTRRWRARRFSGWTEGRRTRGVEDSPGVLWTALAPYDETLRRYFSPTTSREVGRAGGDAVVFVAGESMKGFCNDF